MSLTKKQVKYLKGLGHHLKPVLMIGKHGFTDNVKAEFERVLESHELVKVKVNIEDKEEREPILSSLENAVSCKRVGSIGKTALFYLGEPVRLEKGSELKIKLP